MATSLNLFLNTTTSTANSTKPSFGNTDFMPKGAYWFLNCIMVLTTLAGFTGNGLVTYFFAAGKIKITSFNLMLLNLSISDLLADIFAYPQIFVELEMLRDFSKETANIVCAFTIGITPYAVVIAVSILTLTYVSLNRFIFVKYPFKTKWFKSRRNTVAILVVFWIAGIGYIVPNIFAFRYDPVNAVCYREWPETINVPLWNSAGMVLGLILPVIIMLLTFFATKRQLKRMHTSTSSSDEATKKKRRTVKLLGLLILAFFLCIAPSSIYLLLSISFESIWPPGVEGEHLRMIIIRVTFAICLLNTVADPVIYGYNNKEFQDCFNTVLSRMHCKLRLRNRTPSYVVDSRGTRSSSAPPVINMFTNQGSFNPIAIEAEKVST